MWAWFRRLLCPRDPCPLVSPALRAALDDPRVRPYVIDAYLMRKRREARARRAVLRAAQDEQRV